MREARSSRIVLFLVCLIATQRASPALRGDELQPTRLVVILIVDESLEGTRNERAKLEKAFDAWYSRQRRNGNQFDISFTSAKAITFRFGHLTDGATDPNESLTPESLMKEVQRPILDEHTTLLCYFLGHGVGRPEGPLLLLDNQRGAGDPSCRIGSRTLLTALSRPEAANEVRPKLTVLITDCCSKAATVVDARPTDFEATAGGGVFAELIASDARGMLQITSATYEETNPEASEVAWAPENGTMFGGAFRNLLAMSQTEAQAALAAIRSVDRAQGVDSGDSTAQARATPQVTWQDAFELLHRQTNANYQQYRDLLWRNPRRGAELSKDDVNYLFRQTQERPKIVVNEIEN